MDPKLSPPLLLLLLLLSLSLLSIAVGMVEVDPALGQPVVVSTWGFREAARAAWSAVDGGGSSAVDAVVAGCSACEELRCDGTVGPGGSPDENGETTLDALIMNGTTMEVGSVAGMRYVKDGIKAAKLVMDYTKHTLLVGEKASFFAISMGLPGPTNLSSPESIKKWNNWKENNCQPNFRKNVINANGCGPYHPEFDNSCDHGEERGSNILRANSNSDVICRHNHDTISMAVIDKMGHIAVGTSTNGATFKVPGRPPTTGLFDDKNGSFSFDCLCWLWTSQFSHISVQTVVGDGPIAGSSAYADDEVGACGATGDGDIMMRFLPCYQVVESMRRGMEPKQAAADAISRIAQKYPDFVGAVFAINRKGKHAGACRNWTFQYSVRNSSMDDVEVFTVEP